MKPPQRVLIVDDDAGARDWLAAFMTSRGLAPVCVGSGEEAVEELRRTSPDLVTLDLGLPGMDGLETLRALRAIG
jgi:DNA-binding response OmpR family regulator